MVAGEEAIVYRVGGAACGVRVGAHREHHVLEAAVQARARTLDKSEQR